MIMDTKKIALVTGASRGIGKSIASRLSADGFFVIGTATQAKGVDSINKSLLENGKGYILDISDKDNISSFTKRILEEYQAVDVIVNNAGITKDQLFMKMKDEDWENVVETNLNGAFYITRQLIRPMIKKREGRIINISSVVATTGNPGQTNYVASKAAIEGFGRALAMEVASRNITINSVAPGFIESDMTNKLSDSQKESITKNIPMGRMGNADCISNAVSFLASDEASYITGCVLPVNGGLSMY
jgi:3-oxoacyl-[acyl-carrier protein] reductase